MDLEKDNLLTFNFLGFFFFWMSQFVHWEVWMLTLSWLNGPQGFKMTLFTSNSKPGLPPVFLMPRIASPR